MFEAQIREKADKLIEAFKTYDVKDSGQRTEFSTGAVRDIQTGKGRYDLVPTRPLRRLALRYEGGAVKYGDRNWEKGIPYSRMFDSAIRHLNQAKEWMEQGSWSETDEDHLAAVLFNVMGIMHFQDTGRTDLDDLGGPPTTESEEGVSSEEVRKIETEFFRLLAHERGILFNNYWKQAFDNVSLGLTPNDERNSNAPESTPPSSVYYSGGIDVHGRPVL